MLLEHWWSLVSTVGPGTNPPWILRDDSISIIYQYIFIYHINIYVCVCVCVCVCVYYWICFSGAV